MNGKNQKKHTIGLQEQGVDLYYKNIIYYQL